LEGLAESPSVFARTVQQFIQAKSAIYQARICFENSPGDFMFRSRNLVVVIFSFLTFSINAASPFAQEDHSSAIKLQSTLVSVPVVVSDRQGRYIAGLRAEDFTLLKDRVRQNIAVFEATEEPINVALLLDTSKSARDALASIKDAASGFLRTLRPQDRAMVISFDYEVHVLSALTQNRRTLERAIENADIGTYVGTTLRDAVIEAASRAFKETKGRKAIVLLTDGKDHGSRISEDELLDSVAESDAMIYSIFYKTGFGRGFDGWQQDRFPRRQRGERQRGARRRERMERKNESAEEFLEQISEASAGRFYSSEVTDLEKTFKLIADELRHQYRLGFYANDDKSDGAEHKLTVEVSRPGAVVRARRNYRSAPGES
jgi:VWFA-related protein